MEVGLRAREVGTSTGFLSGESEGKVCGTGDAPRRTNADLETALSAIAGWRLPEGSASLLLVELDDVVEAGESAMVLFWAGATGRSGVGLESGEVELLEGGRGLVTPRYSSCSG